MRNTTTLVVILASLTVTACNTVRGAGEDARSIGQVFSDHPNRDVRQ